MKIVKSAFQILIFLFPVAVLFLYLYFFFLGCSIGHGFDNFSCGVMFPISCLLGLLAVLVAFKLGLLISTQKSLYKWILIYIILIAFPLIFYFIYYL